MITASSCPPSSGGIERIFSSAGLIHTKPNNRVANQRIAKLIQEHRHYGWQHTSEEDTMKNC